MIKWVLLCCLANSIFSHVIGQDIYIPDANFKAYLLKNKEINSNGNKVIEKSEAINFEGKISCNNSNIQDFTGIETFVKLKELEVWGNAASSLNLNKNKNLKSLNIQNSPINVLNIEGLDELENLVIINTYIADINMEGKNKLQSLNLSNSLIEKLDFSTLHHLKEVIISDMNISDIDLSNAAYLNKVVLVNNFSLNRLNLANKKNELLEEIYIIDNAKLHCIAVDNKENIIKKKHAETFFIEENIYLEIECK